MKIGIIGAGIGGLAAAVRLSSKGHDVHVFEANAYAGGKLSDFELRVSTSKQADFEGNNAENVDFDVETLPKRAYRFDAGPSLFTMPQYVEDLFKAANIPIGNYFKYEKMPEICRYFWTDGTSFTAWADADNLQKKRLKT